MQRPLALPLAARPLCRRRCQPISFPACLPPTRPPDRRLPSVTVTYEGLNVETDAAVGAAGIPTVAQWLGADRAVALGRGLLQGRLGGAGQRTTRRLPILRDVKGVLQPVSRLGGTDWAGARHAAPSLHMGRPLGASNSWWETPDLPFFFSTLPPTALSRRAG